MEKIYVYLKQSGLCLGLLAMNVLGLRAQSPQSITYANTGSPQYFTVPSCISSITVEASGAQGQSPTSGGAGGLGAYVKGVITVTPGQVLSIYVGGQNGYNGGGNGGVNGNTTFNTSSASGTAGVGGGASDIRTGGTTLYDRILVAGGGGGGGNSGTWTNCQPASPAGSGGTGGLTGGTGGGGSSTACSCTGGGGNGGGGALSASGGAAGTYNNSGCLQSNWTAGTNGVFGDGGNGSLTFHNGTGGGGGGGGGYYGGGSGGSGSDTTPGGGGGGGSSYTGSATNTLVTSGTQSGDGQVIFTFNFPGGNMTTSSSSQSICAGSSATLTASNVTSYTWSTGSNAPSIVVSPPSTGSYSVQGTNSQGCIIFAVLTVTVDQNLPNVSVSANPSPICAGDTATLSASASGPISYIWDTGATSSDIVVNPADSTVYTVTGINTITGCQSSQSYSLAVNITTFVISSPTVFCKSQPAVISVSGAAASYLWSNNVAAPSITVSLNNNLTYYVTGSTGNCQTTESINVVVSPLPTLSFSLAKPTICKSEATHITAGGNATSYSWSTGATTPSIVITPSTTTTYTLVGTSTAGCSQTITATQLVSACLGIAELSNEMDDIWRIYPNPSNGEFTIQAEAAMNVSVLNETGQMVKQIQLTEEVGQVDVHNLANGIYFIVAEKNGNKAVKKIVVSK